MLSQGVCLSIRHVLLYLRNDTGQGQTVTTEYQYELVGDLSNGGISNDLEWSQTQTSR